MRPARTAPLLLACLLWAGCYPESTGQDELRLSLPLGQMGMSLQDEALAAWLDWLQDDAGGVFDLNGPYSNFFLGLSLQDAGGAELPLYGCGVLYDAVERTLSVGVVFDSDCEACRIEILIYWRHDELLAYEGLSEAFSYPEELSAEVQAQKLGTAYALVSGEQARWVAAQDDEARVRLYPIAELQAGQASLPVPVGRAYEILWSLDGASFQRAGQVKAQESGEQIELSVP
ncbi:MAG: hypothetical protein JXR96_20010 [Deltaproteobacteria bacterium]|nr:hypothetical protein [Deltaproteobacteria bacterium]